MATDRMASFEGYDPPSRGAVKKLITAADQIAAAPRAVHDIRELAEMVAAFGRAPQPTTRDIYRAGLANEIFSILERHGLL